MEKLHIEYIDPYKLKPYENNARKHGDDVETIKASIKEFGMNDPIGVWGEDNLIVEGHGRLQACLELGLKEVPCIHLDSLTDEQRRAYTLAHNKTAENSSWDYELLDLELDGIFDIDMEEFGFDLSIDREAQHQEYADKTQQRVENIVNLGKGEYECEGYYDIPIIKPVYELPPIKEWIGFNYVLSDDNPEGKAVHFFIDDYQFERIWNNPEKYVDKLKQYVCVATPDFSPYGDMPHILQIFNHYRKHWVGAYLQEHGVTVIPTIRASADARSMYWYLDGEPRESIVLISTMWTTQKDLQNMSENLFDQMIEKLNPSKIFAYGQKVEIEGNVEYIPNFSEKRWNR